MKDIPCKSSIHNHFQRIGLSIIRRLNFIVSRTIKTINYSIDSTGIDSRHASKHYEKRIGRTRSPFLKLSILAQSREPYLIDDFAITDTHLHDVNHAKILTKRFRLRNKIIFADKAYDCEELMQINKLNSNLFYAPIRNFKVKRPKGRLRRKITKQFNEDVYNLGRNPVEMIMFLLKGKGLIIRSKKKKNKIKELALKILVYNIERLSKSLQILWDTIISLDKTYLSKDINI
ncbi:MAG: transposase [Candidatus Muiribacteriota bacterium]